MTLFRNFELSAYYQINGTLKGLLVCQSVCLTVCHSQFASNLLDYVISNLIYLCRYINVGICVWQVGCVVVTQVTILLVQTLTLNVKKLIIYHYVINFTPLGIYKTVQVQILEKKGTQYTTKMQNNIQLPHTFMCA